MDREVTAVGEAMLSLTDVDGFLSISYKKGEYYVL